MYRPKALILMFSLLFAQGCAGIAMTTGSMAADAGLDHTLSGISYKTFSVPMDDMRVAVFNTMQRLDMTIDDQIRTSSGWIIIATAGERTIETEFETLTPRMTRLRVVAHDGDFFSRTRPPPPK